MDKRENDELISMLRDLRQALDASPPKDASPERQIQHYRYLIDKTCDVLDSTLVTLRA